MLFERLGAPPAPVTLTHLVEKIWQALKLRGPWLRAATAVADQAHLRPKADAPPPPPPPCAT